MDGSRPTTNQDNELVDDPGNSSARCSVVIAREMLTFPHILVKLWINNEWHHLTSSSLYTTRRQLFFMNAEERMFFRVVPENANTGVYGAVIHHYVPGMTRLLCELLKQLVDAVLFPLDRAVHPLNGGEAPEEATGIDDRQVVVERGIKVNYIL